MNPFQLSWWKVALALLLAVCANLLFYSITNSQLRSGVTQYLPEPDEALQRARCAHLEKVADPIADLRQQLATARQRDAGSGVGERWKVISATLNCWSGQRTGAPSVAPWTPRIGGNSTNSEVKSSVAPNDCPFPALPQTVQEADVRLFWYPPVCVRQHVVGVKEMDASAGTLLRMLTMEATVARGLEGAVYHFTERRKASPTDQKDGKSAAMALDGVRDALTELDRVLLPTLSDLQDFAPIFLRRFILRSINHPFQWTMFLVGWWCLILILWRWQRAGKTSLAPNGGPPPSADSLRRRSVEGAALIDTLAEVVPSMGFIGTVVGMILAMAGIGGVLAADQGPEMYAAMATVTASLSLAFNTTFVGLVISIPIAYLRRRAAAAESSRIDQ